VLVWACRRPPKSRNCGRTPPLLQGAPPPAAASAPAAARAPMRLQHPSAQHEAQGALHPAERALDPQAQHVVSMLLRELDAARQQGSAAQAELAAVKSELLVSLRQRSKQQGGSGGAAETVRRHTPVAAAAAPTRIKAFRPPGQAPPPKAAHKPGRLQGTPSAAARSSISPRPPQEQPVAAALRQENSEMRTHLEALYAHCRHLQRQLVAAASVQPRRAASPVGGRQPLPPHAGLAAAVEELSSPQRRPRSPGHATVAVSSPRADCADLAVAVFQVSAGSSCCRQSCPGPVYTESITAAPSLALIALAIPSACSRCQRKWVSCSWR
jgi:hypothetical protein